MITAAWILAGMVMAFLLLWLAAVVVARVSLAILEKRLRPVVEERFAGREIRRSSYEANFFGLQSRGLGQMRGNGALVLSVDRLFFLQAVNRRELDIPLVKITSVSLVRGHLRKRVGRPLLRVEFLTEDGPDGAAWYVGNPGAWKEALESMTASLPRI